MTNETLVMHAFLSLSFYWYHCARLHGHSNLVIIFGLIRLFQWSCKHSDAWIDQFWNTFKCIRCNYYLAAFFDFYRQTKLMLQTCLSQVSEYKFSIFSWQITSFDNWLFDQWKNPDFFKFILIQNIQYDYYMTTECRWLTFRYCHYRVFSNK